MFSVIKQKGIGLLELMFSLAIIAILIIMASRYYQTARLNQQVNEASEMVNAVYSAGENWLQSNSFFTAKTACDPANNMICDFVNINALPQDFASATANPWGGNITAIGTGTSSTLTVNLSNVPATACNNLVGKFQQKSGVVTSATCTESESGQAATFTVIFYYGGS